MSYLFIDHNLVKKGFNFELRIIDSGKHLPFSFFLGAKKISTSWVEKGIEKSNKNRQIELLGTKSI